MQFDVFTILPEVFPTYLDTSILKKARERGLINVRIHNIRDYTHDKHHVTDDTPYGGGGGMVMKPEPIFRAVETVLVHGPGWSFRPETPGEEPPVVDLRAAGDGTPASAGAAAEGGAAAGEVVPRALPADVPIVLLSPQGR